MSDSSRDWTSAAGRRLAVMVIECLQRSCSLTDLGITKRNNFFDLRGLQLPPAENVQAGTFEGYELSRLEGFYKLHDISLEWLDLTGAILPNLRLTSCRVKRCQFNNAKLSDLRVWATRFEETSFRGADLRRTSLGGGVYEGHWSSFNKVDFSQADLRRASVKDSDFIDCDFGHARLDKVEFEASLVRCRFAGTLREVIFYDRSFESKKPISNPMEDIDFSDAVFRWVEFRRLNLETVRFPADQDHIILSQYRCVLENLLARLAHDETKRGRRFTAVLEICLKWLGPDQRVGVFNRSDLAEIEEAADPAWSIKLLREAEHECSAKKQ